MPARQAIPGLYCEGSWSTAEQKRRHFIVEGQVLKLFGRRGKTFKGQLNLAAVTALRPATDPAAPTGTLELQLDGVVRASRRPTSYFLAPERSAAELFLALGGAVPSQATSDDLWRTHMRSRPAGGIGGTGQASHEYRVGRTLGTGTFGKVKLAQRLADGQMVAIKCLNRNRIVFAAQGERLAREIRLLKLLNHPNVIRLHEALHTPSLRVACRTSPWSTTCPRHVPQVLHTPSEILMVMEYVHGGDLLEVLNTQPRFREEQVRAIFAQICCGVSFCHSLGVAHRDLKPENILLERVGDDFQIRVADFGLSTIMQAEGAGVKGSVDTHESLTESK